MRQEELDEILLAHEKWLESDGKGGVRADLSGANLRNANLRNADLRNADLSYANLNSADLRNADLSGANMDYAVLPLWCGGLCMHVDDRIGIQLLYHAVKNILFSKNTSAWLKKAVSCKAILNAVNKFHRVDECGEIEAYRKAG